MTRHQKNCHSRCKNRHVRGDLTVCGDVTACENLTVRGDTTLQDKLFVTDQIFAGKSFITGDRELELPPGPYAVDYFSIGRDNVQLRAPEKWLVSSVRPLDVPFKSFVNPDDGLEYFGELQDDKPVFMTYPLPLNIHVCAPSKREDKETTFDFFPVEDADTRFIGTMSLEGILAGIATSFTQSTRSMEAEVEDGWLTPQLYQYTENFINDEGITFVSVPIAVRDLDLSDWVGLQGKKFLNPQFGIPQDAYEALVAVQALLQNDLVGFAYFAMYIMALIMGSDGVSLTGEVAPPTLGFGAVVGPEFVIAAPDRKRAFDLLNNSSAMERIRTFQCYSKRHASQLNKGPENGLYNTQYDFGQITRVGAGEGKSPLFICSEPASFDASSNWLEHLASWGITTCMYSIAYRFGVTIRTPGKWRSGEEIINGGDCLPDCTTMLGNTFWPESRNYAFQATSAESVSQGSIMSMGFQYNANNTNTGFTSRQFNEDIISAVVASLTNATDVNGTPLTEAVEFTGMGVYGRSGGSMALSGAHAIEQQVPGSFSCGFADDIVLSAVYILDAAPEKQDYTGGLGDAIFPGGLNFPVCFSEPVTDWYALGNSFGGLERNVVGARQALQHTLRQTPYPIRSLSVYVEQPRSGHINMGKPWQNSDASRAVSAFPKRVLPEARVPNTVYDPIWGFKDTEQWGALNDKVRQNIFYLYVRAMMSPTEPELDLAVMRYLPVKVEYTPWTIPGADDYQWNSREYSMDIGGKFQLSINAQPTNVVVQRTGVITPGEFILDVVTIDDESVEYLDVLLEWPTDSEGNQTTPDLDLDLLKNGASLTLSYNSKPERFRWDLRRLKNRLGDYEVYSSSFNGGATTYTLTITTGYYEAVLESTLNENAPSLALGRDSVRMIGIPSSSAGLLPGDVYQDNGMLKIIPTPAPLVAARSLSPVVAPRPIRPKSTENMGTLQLAEIQKKHGVTPQKPQPIQPKNK